MGFNEAGAALGRRRRILSCWGVGAVLAVAMIGSIATAGWRTASRESAQLAPLPSEEPAAVVQAYAAAVYGWRGFFADHTWIAVKGQDAETYTVYEKIGWRLRRNLPAVRIAQDVPDRHWFGKKPRLLLDLRGDSANELIPKIQAAAESYPYPNEYLAFPGPNSNTFIAWIRDRVPELGLELPMRAVGKSYSTNPAGDESLRGADHRP